MTHSIVIRRAKKSRALVAEAATILAAAVRSTPEELAEMGLAEFLRRRAEQRV